MNTYGPILKKYREAKGYSLRALADGIVSYQFLSNFENGRSDISLTNFTLLLNKLNVTYAEFFEQTKDFNSSFIDNFSEKVMKALIARNKSGIIRISKEYQDKFETTADIKYAHLATLAKIMYSVHDATIEISEAEKKVIKDYLFSIESWSNYEYFLFTSAMYIYPVDFVLSMYTRAYEKIISKNFVIYDKTFFVDDFILNVVLYLLHHDHIDEAQKALYTFKTVGKQEFRIMNFGMNILTQLCYSMLLIRQNNIEGALLACKVFNAVHFVEGYEKLADNMLNNFKKHLDKSSLTIDIEVANDLFVIVEQN